MPNNTPRLGRLNPQRTSRSAIGSTPPPAGSGQQVKDRMRVKAGRVAHLREGDELVGHDVAAAQTAHARPEHDRWDADVVRVARVKRVGQVERLDGAAQL